MSIRLANVLKQTAAAWTTVCISPRSRWRSNTEFWDESIIDLKSISGHMNSSRQMNANGALFALDERQRWANYSQSTLRALSSTWKKNKNPLHCWEWSHCYLRLRAIIILCLVFSGFTIKTVCALDQPQCDKSIHTNSLPLWRKIK